MTQRTTLIRGVLTIMVAVLLLSPAYVTWILTSLYNIDMRAAYPIGATLFLAGAITAYLLVRGSLKPTWRGEDVP